MCDKLIFSYFWFILSNVLALGFLYNGITAYNRAGINEFT